MTMPAAASCAAADKVHLYMLLGGTVFDVSHPSQGISLQVQNSQLSPCMYMLTAYVGRDSRWTPLKLSCPVPAAVSFTGSSQMTVRCALQVSYLILTSQMLVEMKVKELKYKARQRALQQKQSGQESKKDS